MEPSEAIARIRGSAAVALECLKSAHTQGDAWRYIQQVLDMIDVMVSIEKLDQGLSPPMSDAEIKLMVDRFLGWKLPENFAPDGGISFEKTGNTGTPHQYAHKPSGTNLLDATQAEAMVRHMVEDL